MKTCWLVTSSLARTCRSCFEMESLEMKRIVEISWSQWRLGHNINASGRRYGRYQWTTWNLETQARANSATAVWKMLAWQAHGLSHTYFCIGCHGNTLLLPDVSSTEAFDWFLRLMILYLSSLGANLMVRWMLLDKHEGPSFPSRVISTTSCLGLTAESIALIIQACGRSSISLLVVTLSDGARGERRRASDCFYTSISNSIPGIQCWQIEFERRETL